MSMPIDFAALRRRYEQLDSDPRAELRRARSPEDLSSIPGFYRLLPDKGHPGSGCGSHSACLGSSTPMRRVHWGHNWQSTTSMSNVCSKWFAAPHPMISFSYAACCNMLNLL
jgi:hypothetical protein